MLRGLAAAALILLASAPALAAAGSASPSTPSNALGNAPGSAIGELDAVRQECIAAGRDVQQQEQAVAALEHDTLLLEREAAGRRRDLDESRVEQAQLLGMIERLARNPPDRAAPGRFTPDRFALVAEAPIDRIRSKLLLETAIPALRVKAGALASEVERVAALRTEIATKQAALAAARGALGKDRKRLALLIARRLEVDRRLRPEEAASAAEIIRLGHQASNIGDLIKRADAASDHHDKVLLARARAALPRALKAMASALTAEAADLTRPHEVRAFDPPHSALTMPVSGTISGRFGAADGAEAKSQGLRLATLSGGEVVAPFDGRVVYAGRFGNLGLVLIIRHGGLYHTLLSGLGRVDIKVDQWVLAGEPVGAMPDAVDNAAGTLYVELRRDGRAVDPQPHLAIHGEGRGGQDGNQKVHE
jgi:murein hydrolase activator